MDITVPVIAGALSTTIFAGSTLPMLAKASRSKDLGSYSLGNLALSNVGNVVHSVYVFSLPPGPVWVLHTFYVFAALLMLTWYVRYQLLGMRGRGVHRTTQRARPAQLRVSAEAERTPASLAS